jgi:histidyl-tRNA synthetase
MPQEQALWRYVEQKAADVCRRYGYERIDTPAFEDTMLFSRGTGETTDIVEKETYTFEDRGGNSLTLRAEGTPPVCRAYIEHGLHNRPQPVKLYYITPIFRYDRPQAGRYRQHYQFGIEAIGDGDPALDAEIIDLAWQFLHSMNLSGLRLLINSIGDPQCRPGYLEVLKGHYGHHIDELCADCRNRLQRNPLRLLDCKQQRCQEIAEGAPKSIDHLCQECADHFESLKESLSLLGIPFAVDAHLVRGLDYYTRTVFEVQPQEAGAQSAICGGGRYDGLVERLGGRPTPGIGFGLGIERLILNLKETGVSVSPIPGPDIFIAHLGAEARNAALRLASTLRRGGNGAIVATGGRSLKAQLRQANNLGVPRVAIIGEDEVKSGTVMLREMATSSQESVPVGKLHELLR